MDARAETIPRMGRMVEIGFTDEIRWIERQRPPRIGRMIEMTLLRQRIAEERGERQDAGARPSQA